MECGVRECVLSPRHRPSAGLFPIIVSQDCGHAPTANTISSYGNRITHIKVGSYDEMAINRDQCCFHSNQIYRISC